MALILAIAAGLWGLGHLLKAPYSARFLMIALLYVGVLIVHVALPDGHPLREQTGGSAGATGELEVNGEKTDPKRQYVLKHGDTVQLSTPGGGGHGDPAGRDDDVLRHDLEEGYVSDGGIYRES